MVFPTLSFAANVSGYAWSESLGWFDFSRATISNTSVTGYAYNDNTGWLVLEGVTNTNGTLSGSAWSESVGYFNFSQVTIQNGRLRGQAYNDNTGWLSFETSSDVTTTWSPPSSTVSTGNSGGWNGPTGGGSGGGSYSSSYIAPTSQTPQTPVSSSTPYVFTKNLSYGMKNSDVLKLQQYLQAKGYLKANPNGNFGPATRSALINFQKANNIAPAVGYFGPVTRLYINTTTNTR